MEIYSTEEQQVDAIKKWWSDNKWSVIGGIAVGIAALWGGRAWIDNQNTNAESASMQYQLMMENLSRGQNDEAANQGAQLLGQHVSTPYAALASLALAKIKLEAGDSVAAAAHLRWALDNASQESVKHEARLRLARLLLADAKYDEALSTLTITDTGSYLAEYESLKGDVYVAEGKPEFARTAYTRALGAMEPRMQGRDLLQMKLDDLGPAPGAGGVS